MPFDSLQREWYLSQIEALDPKKTVVHAVDRDNNSLTYCEQIRCDESHLRKTTDEELVRALALCMLSTKSYKYDPADFYIEKYYKHGHPASKRDEVDLVIFDTDGLPFAMWEFKSPDDYAKSADEYIRLQLFGTAPLVGAPKLLVYATITPNGKPHLTLTCIDHTKFPSFESWDQASRAHSKTFPPAFTDPTYEPYVCEGTPDIRLDCTQADFRTTAATFHAEFFGEHPDNVLFTNLMKCLLAKIYDERMRKKGEAYEFQVLYKRGKEEKATEVFTRVNELYKTAYKRFIEPKATEPDEINQKEFAPDRVKTVVKALQGMSITRGAALHGDVIGAFFEEILRAGFKQDKGMYFTHANLVNFILEAMDLDGLTIGTWKKATHPENRMPYLIDPACGSGSFLLRAMHIMTNAIRSRTEELVTDADSKDFVASNMPDNRPNYWAERFVYGMDPKFVMAITAKINMVLHGDGSAHIFKYDALKPFHALPDERLRTVSDPQRSIPRDKYRYEVAESFDAVVSNPPFGITLASDTRRTVDSTFSLGGSVPSESLFLERWFQLLKPKGRMGVVVPESLLNSADNVDARLFLYRLFWIRAIVSLPRNLFIETPTLTSLLFAQKKTADEIAAWDGKWQEEMAQAETKIRDAVAFLKGAKSSDKVTTMRTIEQKVIEKLSPMVTHDAWITKKGKPPLTLRLPDEATSSADANRYYAALFKLAGFRNLVRNFVFGELCKALDYEFPVYEVEEVGYKLSKRKERLRPNQLCRFIGVQTRQEAPNLHLASEPVEVVVNAIEPERILDFVRRDVKWF